MAVKVTKPENTKERILRAYEDLIQNKGVQSATLEQVAKSAKVSKGGLLYYFPNKAALTAGLCEKAISLVREDAEKMRTHSQGPAQYYILTSRYLGTPLDRALVSVAKLQQTGDQEATRTLAQANEIWTQILSENLNNPRTVRVLKLMGDGLYYDALFHQSGEQSHDLDASEEAELISLTNEIIAHLDTPASGK